MDKHKFRPSRPQAPRLRRPAIYMAVLLMHGAASAMEIDTGNPDVKIHWDTTLKYSNAYRLEAPANGLVDAGRFGSLTANQNDGDNNFKKGIVSNRFDILSEFDIASDKFGARVSAAAWYDTVYQRSNDNRTSTSNHTPANEFPAQTRTLMGRNVEVLDAFIFGKNEIAERSFTWRLGRHTLLWGESLFFGSNAIAGGQAPLDLVKLLSVPNSTFKEVARPTGKFSAQLQVSDTVAIGAYYQYEWLPTRLIPVGSYLSSADSFGPGKETINAGPTGVFIAQSDLTPRNSGQFGFQTRIRAASLDTDFGLYAIRYHTTTPSNIYTTLTGFPPALSASSYRWAYHEGIRAFGASAAKSIGNWSLAAEISYKQNNPLDSVGQTILPSIRVNTALDNKGNPGYAVGNTAHVQFSWLTTLDPSFIANEASLLGEVAWNTRVRVTQNPKMLNPNADKSATALRVVYTPTYRQIVPGLDISLPVGLGYTWGKSSAVGPAFGVDKGGDFNIGVTGTYLGGWTVALNYVRFIGPEGTTLDAENHTQYKQALKDRDFLSFSIRNTF